VNDSGYHIGHSYYTNGFCEPLVRGMPAGGAKTIPVLGIAKGGTSVVAAILDAMGVYMAPPSNSSSTFENQVFMLNRSIVPDGMKNIPGEICKLNQKFTTWGFKNPNGISVARLMVPLLRNPHAIVVFRDPFAIAQRRAITDGWKGQSVEELCDAVADEWRALWDEVNEATYPRLLVSYERLINNPAPFVAAVANFLDISLTDSMWVASLARVGPKGGYVLPVGHNSTKKALGT